MVNHLLPHSSGCFRDWYQFSAGIGKHWSNDRSKMYEILPPLFLALSLFLITWEQWRPG